MNDGGIHGTASRRHGVRRAALALVAVAALVAPAAAHAQTVQILGGLGNFDAANNTGQDANGFEVQLEGIRPSDIFVTWTGNRYGTPVIEPYATGVYVRYESLWDASTQSFTQATIPFAGGGSFAGTCYMGSASYATSGCEHFGVHLNYGVNPTATAYRWMFADAQNPGSLTTMAPSGITPAPLYVAAPVWTVIPPPPTQPTAPPTVVAEIVAPEAPNPDLQWGDAVWIRVYKTELQREVALTELVSDNPIVPQDAATLETNWKLIQQSPPTSRKQRGKQVNQGQLGGGSRSVLRRYESYAYTGAYDPLTHEAVCGGDGSCNAPLDGELGDLISAQMAAVNLGVPSLAVSVVGGGSVTSADKFINCPSKSCVSSYAVGATVSLTASPSSGNALVGWTGACAGQQLTCAVTMNDSENVTATFLPQFTLSVGRSNPGTVVATPNGNDRQLSCGSNCSAKFTQGTAVTLTATPPAGKQFVGWSGGCAGTNPSCTVTMSKDTSVLAAFSK